jgi:hypothetical protein
MSTKGMVVGVVEESNAPYLLATKTFMAALTA